MGLAASQARFLGITARKSNIEYEGQQVNQQRTALAEEVNALYSSLIALEAPMPPDTTQFYESNYSFTISDTTNGIDGDYRVKNYKKIDNGYYTVPYTRTYEEWVAKQSDLATQGWKIRQKQDDQGNISYELYKTGKDGEETKFGLSLASDLSNESMRDLINKNKGLTPLADPENQAFYSYTDGGNTYYIPKNLVEGFEDTETSASPLYSYHRITEQRQEDGTFENATIEFDKNGRPKSISVEGYTGLEVNTTRFHNDEDYEAALRDYTMEKDEYNKMVADLNARTESLQQEDKVLELRLNQIDTEQQQLSTELEAVKNVLKENIESTFKTFS